VAFLWLGERLSLSRVAGLLIGFAGVGVLVWGTAFLAEPITAHMIAGGIVILFGTAPATQRTGWVQPRPQRAG
jgi:drug/metabolite transporter (DMT)-like permease